MVITSPGDHFVDIRAYKDKTSGTFNELFQWCITGKEAPVEGTSRIKFIHEIDSMAVVNGQESGEVDEGDFSAIEGSEDRKEVGEMKNPATGKVQPYVEIWRSLSPIENTPEHEVREIKGEKVTVKVFTVANEKFNGKYIEYGNWSQGILHDVRNNSLHVIRGYFRTQKWELVIEYGDSKKFPIGSNATLGELDSLSEELVWTCVENV